MRLEDSIKDTRSSKEARARNKVSRWNFQLLNFFHDPIFAFDFRVPVNFQLSLHNDSEKNSQAAKFQANSCICNMYIIIIIIIYNIL